MSGTTSNQKSFIMDNLKLFNQRYYCLEFLLISLAVIQKSWHVSAYNIVSMTDICNSGSYYQNEIRLSAGGSNSAASLFMDVAVRDVEPRICVVEVHAPNTHVLSVQLAGLTVAKPRQETELRKYNQACPLSVFSVAKGSKVPRLLRTVDLCDDDEATTTFTELYNRNHVTLIWTPPHGNFSNAMQASEIVITAVGIGTGVCKKYWPLGKSQTHYPCWKQYGKLTPYCVASELICDGRRNCPNDGEDEDPELCGVLVPANDAGRQAEIDARRAGTRQQVVKSTSQQVASREKVTILHQVVIGQLNATSTSTETVLQIDKASESFPEVLSRYGPWGYVMLGILICGSVLLVCGIWECCCRRLKTPAETPTTVFVIGADQPEDANLPPAYDDLDQPPSYNILFPMLSKSDLPVLTQVACVSDVQRTEVGTSASVNSGTLR